MVSRSDEIRYLTAQSELAKRIQNAVRPTIASVLSSGVSPSVIRDDLIVVGQTVVSEFGSASALLGATWYDEFRANSGAPAGYEATEFVDDYDLEVDQTVRRVVGPLFTDKANPEVIAETLTSKIVEYAINGARSTIVQNTYRDPNASGWARVPFGATCDFCLMLVGRGGVYRTEASARFKSHRNCNCGAVPSWDPTAQSVPTIAYQASQRMQGLRDRAANGDRSAQRQLSAYRDRVSSYIENNQDEFARLRRAYDLTPAE